MSASGSHTYHPNTFGLLYGKTTKTACNKRVPTAQLVKPMQATCAECQAAVIAAMLEAQEIYNAALSIAQAQGFRTIADWKAAQSA